MGREDRRPRAAVSERREANPRLRDGLRDALVAFLVARLILLAISLIGTGMVEPPPGQPTSVLGWPAILPVGGWAEQGWEVAATATERQDALWFLRIATDGYRDDDGSAAFFPLYPLTVRIVASVPILGPLGAALLVSNASFLAALLVLHALTRFELGREAARRTVWLVALFPTAFFFLAPYTESLFLLLSVSAFWFARRDRWLVAAIAGAGAAVTRSVGLLLILGLGVEAIRQWRREHRPPLPRLVASAAVAVGPALYGAWWWIRSGSPWAPLDAQSAWRPDGVRTPWETLERAIEMAIEFRMWWLLDVAVLTLAVVGLALAARRIPLAYTTYAAGSVALPLILPYLDRPLVSVPRFVAVLFPAAWGFAVAAERRPWVEPATLATFAAAYGLLAFLFVNWQYVF